MDLEEVLGVEKVRWVGEDFLVVFERFERELLLEEIRVENFGIVEGVEVGSLVEWIDSGGWEDVGFDMEIFQLRVLHRKMIF